jgi:signal peptidase I
MECLVTALVVLVVLVAAVCISARMVRRRFAVVTVSGPSMEPTLNSGDRVLIRRATSGGLRTGQIVVVVTPVPGEAAADQLPHWPPVQSGWIIKRVAATAGEPAPVAMLTTLKWSAEPIVPPGKLAVLGDNLARSLDSRHLGYVPAERVLGIAIRSLPARRPADQGQQVQRMVTIPAQTTTGRRGWPDNELSQIGSIRKTAPQTDR